MPAVDIPNNTCLPFVRIARDLHRCCNTSLLCAQIMSLNLNASMRVCRGADWSMPVTEPREFWGVLACVYNVCSLSSREVYLPTEDLASPVMYFGSVASVITLYIGRRIGAASSIRYICKRQTTTSVSTAGEHLRVRVRVSNLSAGQSLLLPSMHSARCIYPIRLQSNIPKGFDMTAARCCRQ
ncbi:hypothetical protein DAEQUDRAFT_397073 [Daedalea quercina L-15889]|uniref:Uncharacterized protein n=1 Tax=Daedalea quercina L-15889 TaxID=1314783 RepID=A0A165NT95_9APHY|nr:hypothetical protein DAEQUDRAFT_397073 [Daedalea quercina L-15889]